jgi:hypothetical protein
MWCEYRETSSWGREQMFFACPHEARMGPNGTIVIHVLANNHWLYTSRTRWVKARWIAFVVTVVEQKPEEYLLVAPVLGRR